MIKVRTWLARIALLLLLLAAITSAKPSDVTGWGILVWDACAVTMWAFLITIGILLFKWAFED